MFHTIIVQPIFNVLVLIYALIPGHNFGLAIILFTILVRVLLYPLLRKQLHHGRAMRELAPEIKRIKAAAKGDRQKESRMTMELYKEREINPFSSLGLVLLQIPILIGLYLGLQKIIHDPHDIINFSYPAIQHLGWLQTLSHDIHQFDNSLFGFMDLSRTVVGTQGLYVPALILALMSAIMQYIQSRMLLPKPKDARNLRALLKEAGKGQQADQAEVSAAVGRGTIYLIPIVVFLVSLNLAAALPLYWFTSAFIATLQQRKILAEDVQEAKASVKVTTRTLTETEDESQPKLQNQKRRKSPKKRKKR